jgi:hypothetical protein
LEFKQLGILAVVKRKHSFLVDNHFLLGLLDLFVVVDNRFGDQGIKEIILCLVLWQL